MKQLISVLLLFQSIILMAQVPQQFSYQAVIRDASDELLSDQQISMRVSILEESEFGAAVYVETHSATTNVNGLVNIQIGTGTPVLGTFTSINWLADNYFVRTETDPAGGTSYSISGTSQFLSVPYALTSAVADSVDMSMDDLNDVQTAGVSNGDVLKWDGNNWLPQEDDGASFWENSGNSIYYSSGNVGIGENLPSVPLHVTSTSEDELLRLEGPTASNSRLAFYNGLAFRGLIETGSGMRIRSLSGGLALMTGNTERLRVASAGNVGIGTDNPLELLHVDGDTRIDGDADISGTLSLFNSESLFDGGANVIGTNDRFSIDFNSSQTNPHIDLIQPGSLSARLHFSNDASTTDWRISGAPMGDDEDAFLAFNYVSRVLTLTGDGQVGVNTTNPSQTLHLRDTDASIRLDNTSGIDWTISNSGNLFFSSSSGGGASINSSTGAYSQFSDRRLKTDIEELPDILQNFLKVRPVDYQFKNSTETIQRSAGVIAQEVQEVFPSTVSEGANGYLTVDYAQLSVYAIKAIQEQQKIINKLQEQVSTLRALIIESE